MVEITRLSTKGQIVIPQKVREKFDLNEGNLLTVIDDDDSIILKKLETPKTKSWDEVTKPFRDSAKKSNFTQNDLSRIIAQYRLKKK